MFLAAGGIARRIGFDQIGEIVLKVAQHRGGRIVGIGDKTEIDNLLGLFIADKFGERIAKNDDFRQSILYFLLFDPGAPPAADPRPSLPKAHFAPGLGRLYARTSWDGDAATFDFLGLDHLLDEQFVGPLPDHQLPV